MKHEFILIKLDEIPKTTTYELKGNRYTVIVHDDIIVNNPLFLKGFKSFKVSFKNPSEGLDYHGNTIIPTTSLQDFLTNVIKSREIEIIPEEIFNGPDGDIFKSIAIKIKPEIHMQLDELITLCKQAIAENLYIIHFGI